MASDGFTEYFEKEVLRKRPYRLAEARAVARCLQQLVRPIGRGPAVEFGILKYA